MLWCGVQVYGIGYSTVHDVQYDRVKLNLIGHVFWNTWEHQCGYFDYYPCII